MTINELRNTIIKYIEDNKSRNKIEYSYSLSTIDLLIDEIYKEYIEIMKKENEKEG